MFKSNKTNKGKSKIDREIYLDYASSVDPNPSSIHNLGVKARRKLENAREKVANVLSARPSQVIFTGGGTESNNIAIQGVIWRIKNKKIPPHIITTNIEHPSVLDTYKILEAQGLVTMSIVPVETNGIVDPKKVKKEIKENTVLVSVMYANNEIGTVQPIKEIAKEIRHFRKNKSTENAEALLRQTCLSKASARMYPLFHTDAVQAANYLDLNVDRLGVDLLTLSGSKIENGGKVGVLYIKSPDMLVKVFGGGDQEMGLRPGTEDVEGVVNLANAIEYTQKIKDKESNRLLVLRKYFLEKLVKLSSSNLDKELLINGDLEDRLPNNVNITIPNIPSDLLVIELSARGIYISAKSACKSGDGKISHVIKAINPEIKETDGSLRFSFGRDTTKADINYTIQSLSDVLIKLKKWYY